MNLMDIINGLMTYLYGKTTGKNGPYSALLSRERFSVFEKEIQGKIICDESIHVRLAELREQCMKIRQDRRYTVLCSTEDASFDHINACMNRIIELSDKEVIECISLLFDLTYSLGYIWNVDIDMRVKIDKILHENYSCSSYDNRCLYEIYCCSDISKYPYSRMQ